MKRAPSLACLCLAVVTALAAVPAPSARAEGAGRPEVWVAFGDSLTASPPWPWSDILARETGNRVINAGRDGATIRGAVRFLEADVLRHQPDLVFVMYGVNDQSIPDDGEPDGYRVPPKVFAAKLDTVITRIQASGARVVLMTNRPLVQGPGAPRLNLYLDRHGDGGRLYTLPRKTKDSIRLYNDIIRAKAREHGTVLVDIWQAIVDRAGSDRDADLLRLGLERPPPHLDGVHLGPHGARFYADTILKAMPFRPPRLGAGEGGGAPRGRIPR
jgi:lysophospholipase L1-like esterase